MIYPQQEIDPRQQEKIDKLARDGYKMYESLQTLNVKQFYQYFFLRYLGNFIFSTVLILIRQTDGAIDEQKKN